MPLWWCPTFSPGVIKPLPTDRSMRVIQLYNLYMSVFTRFWRCGRNWWRSLIYNDLIRIKYTYIRHDPCNNAMIFYTFNFIKHRKKPSEVEDFCWYPCTESDPLYLKLQQIFLPIYLAVLHLVWGVGLHVKQLPQHAIGHPPLQELAPLPVRWQGGQVSLVVVVIGQPRQYWTQLQYLVM